MIIYSKKIIQFTDGIKQIVKEVVLREAGLKVWGDRFYDRQQNYSYPIKVVIYNDESMLGYFDSDFYEMGFHESLMNSSRQQLYNVIRHELAHYITFIHWGAVQPPHSQEFRTTCEKMGWGEDVQRAEILLKREPNDRQENENDVLRKVKKLLALASSSNVYEAETAMLKSRQLLLKHHLETPISESEDDGNVVLKRIMRQKRLEAKGRAIGRILQTFFVNIVYSRTGKYTCLEVLGDSVNVSIAEYVANVLDHELEILWTQAQKGTHLRGKVARNSFFLGLAIGYCNKVQSLKRDTTVDAAHALMVTEKRLADTRAMVYPRLSSSKSSACYCHDASMLGEKMGKQLNINPAIKKSSDKAETLLLQF